MSAESVEQQVASQPQVEPEQVAGESQAQPEPEAAASPAPPQPTPTDDWERKYRELHTTHRGTAQEREKLAKYISPDRLKRLTEAGVTPEQFIASLDGYLEEVGGERRKRDDEERNRPVTRGELEEIRSQERAALRNEQAVASLKRSLRDVAADKAPYLESAAWSEAARRGLLDAQGNWQAVGDEEIAECARHVRSVLGLAEEAAPPAPPKPAKPKGVRPTPEEAAAANAGPRNTPAAPGSVAPEAGAPDIQDQITEAYARGDLATARRLSQQVIDAAIAKRTGKPVPASAA